MRRPLPFLLALALATGSPPPLAGAQAAGVDSATERAAAAFARATRSARARLAADAGRLWGARLDTLPWIGIAGPVALLSDDPRLAGYARRADGLWSGPPPAGLAPANTSVEWAGRRWAMFLLPLPDDTLDAARLLIHEAAHVLQPSALPAPPYSETGPGTDLLDGAEGRTWLRLEWRALAGALEGSGAARRRAARDALAFRARRLAAATREERTRERALDAVEGIPEYTAWRLTGAPAAAFARHLREGAERSASFVRAFPYFTGPAYALLLDDALGAAWRRAPGADADFSRLLAASVEASRPVRAALAGEAASGPALRSLADAAAARYGVARIRAEENARAAERERRVAELRARFVDGPTLRLRPAALRIAFDPRRQTSLGAAGTVMGGLVWRGEAGAELSAPDGALVASDWSELRVPLDGAALADGPLGERLQLTGRGWTLTLPPGWIVRREGASAVLVPATGR